MSKQKVCSVTMKDLEEQPFCGSGPGGQNRNRNRTAIRLIHHPSGARAESQKYKSQMQNKRAAFKKLAQSDEFMRWARKQAGINMMDEAALEKRVDKSMQPQHLHVETKADNGTWQKDTGETNELQEPRHDTRES